MVDHEQVACLHVFFSVSKRLVFRLHAQEETGGSQKFQYGEKLWCFKQGLRYTEGIFSCLRTEQVLRGEKGLMGCRNGSIRYFDRQTRIPAPRKIYKHFLPRLQRNQEKFGETLNQAECDGLPQSATNPSPCKSSASFPWKDGREWLTAGVWMFDCPWLPQFMFAVTFINTPRIWDIGRAPRKETTGTWCLKQLEWSQTDESSKI